MRGSTVWVEKEKLLSSVPGVGKTIARTLIAELPELGSLDRRRIAALVGLAPWTRQSGRWRGKSFIGGGRKSVRSSLFIGAMVAARYNPQLKQFRDKLVAAGKSKVLALVAVARKLITILNAILRDRRPWQPPPLEFCILSSGSVPHGYDVSRRSKSESRQRITTHAHCMRRDSHDA